MKERTVNWLHPLFYLIVTSTVPLSICTHPFTPTKPNQSTVEIAPSRQYDCCNLSPEEKEKINNLFEKRKTPTLCNIVSKECLARWLIRSLFLDHSLEPFSRRQCVQPCIPWERHPPPLQTLPTLRSLPADTHQQSRRQWPDSTPSFSCPHTNRQFPAAFGKV